MKQIVILLALALGLLAPVAAKTTRAGDKIVQYTVTATSETYLTDTMDNIKFNSWQKSGSDESLIIIDWENGTIVFNDHGVIYEGPYYITSTGEPYKDARGRLSVKLGISEGFDDEGTFFIISVTEGDSVKEMTKGYLYQVFSEDVFGFEIRK